MKSTTHRFVENAEAALRDSSLQQALAKAKSGFVDKRRKAIARLPEYEALREAAVAIKDHALANLDRHLEQFERQVIAAGGQVHWARDAAEANAIVRSLVGGGRKRILKGKTMVAEEMGLNEALENAGHEVVETDLGEYIIQLAKEPPSHIIAPAVHKTRTQIADLFRAQHAQFAAARRLTEVPDLVNEARAVLREKFLSADVGITGANFLIAETGQTVIVTNEGNGDLAQTLPRMHIVTASIEKIVPTLDDMTVLLRLLTRSATGQDITSYVTLSAGPRRAGDPDGPGEFHVVLLDNGRSRMLAGPFRDMLRCIRCGACLNHCPVYSAIGGHAYGWVYPGPMGAVLTPLFTGLDRARDLPQACTLNGRCEEVCPVKIPLPRLIRELRFQTHERKLNGVVSRTVLRAWGRLARRPALYHSLNSLAVRLLSWAARGRGALRRLPLASGWLRARDLPAPPGETFQSLWRKRSANE
jgi:L-lactate dehydrogenase complex protein LldF